MFEAQFQTFDEPETGVALTARLSALREELARRKLSGFVIPRADQQQNEYVAPSEERLAWLTGFTGSAGLAFVLTTEAAVFVDGRYTLQAAKQVDRKAWHIEPLADPPPESWLSKHLVAGDRLGFDPWLHTSAAAERLATACSKSGAELVAVETNPVDSIWSGRPPPPLGPVAIHGAQFSGEAEADKLGRIRIEIDKLGVDALVLSDSHAVAWSFNIRGADVFVLQTHCEPINDRIFEQLIMIDAAKRASAKRITAVCPFYGYARQDRKAAGREPITARLLADLLTVAGADRVVTVDLHTGQIQGFFDFPVDHLTAVPLLAGYVANRVDGEVTVVAPDAGGGKLARRFANCLDIEAELAFVDKSRPKGTHNVAVANDVVGVIEGRHCVLVDDMIDTAGSITAGAELLMDRGAESVIIAATHGLLSGPAVDRLKNARVREVVVTNTLPISDDKRFDSLTVLSIAPIVAEVLGAVFGDKSVSELFRGDNL